MKEFKILAGTDDSTFKEILHSGLKNDFVPETFSLRHTNDAGIQFPTRFVKIIPLS
jgi:muskelin